MDEEEKNNPSFNMKSFGVSALMLRSFQQGWGTPWTQFSTSRPTHIENNIDLHHMCRTQGPGTQCGQLVILYDPRELKKKHLIKST